MVTQLNNGSLIRGASLLKHSLRAILRRPENHTEKDDIKLADIVRASENGAFDSSARGSLCPLDLLLAGSGRDAIVSFRHKPALARCSVLRQRPESSEKIARINAPVYGFYAGQ